MAAYETHIDWNNDGDYDDANENVSTRINTRNTPVVIQYGRDQARSLSPMAIGRAQFHLTNTSRDYSPENTSSPLVGNLRPGRRVRVRATHNSNTYTLYLGRTDEFSIAPAISDQLAEFTALDGLADIAAVSVSTEIFQVIRSGEAIGKILDACGWTAGRDLDAGASVFPFWWEDGTDGLSAVKNVLASEGPESIVYIGPSGEFVFRDRHHRLMRSASITSQATFSATGVEPLFSDPFGYDAGWREVVNTVNTEVTERVVDSVLSEVYSDTRLRNLGLGETLSVLVKLSDPVMNAVVPVSGTDFTTLSGTVSVALSRTSGQSIEIQIRGTTAAQIEGLKLRANRVASASTVKIAATDAGSISVYGVRALSYDAPWVSVNDAVGVLQRLVLQRAERLPVVQLNIVGANATRLTQQLARDLSDRVTVIESGTGLDADFYIEQIKHEIDTAIHTTTFGCEKVVANVTGAFVLDISQLDVGRVARDGFILPVDLFILDSTTQGLIGTNLLAY